MKKFVALILLLTTICLLSSCTNNGLFKVENITYTAGQVTGIIGWGPVGGEQSEYEIYSNGTYSYDLIGRGETDAIYTVHIQIGIYNSNNTYVDSIYDICVLKENERKTISGECLGYPNIKFKVLKITWN